jgi:regulator of protease activity HflC (stomatin/prohibitin superfamily)
MSLVILLLAIVAIVVIVVIVLLVAGLSVRQVQQYEKGVVLRFGRPAPAAGHLEVASWAARRTPGRRRPPTPSSPHATVPRCRSGPL